MTEIQTVRLRLVPLSADQLRRYLDTPERLESALSLPVSRDILTDTVRRAIEMKLDKISRAEVEDHPWFTYWLIVVAGEGFGAGLAGFKGSPDDTGQVEIGYGIDPAYQGQGYTTETVRALLDWAFEHPACRSVVAPGTLKSNVASNRVLEKVGMTVYEETPETLSWRIENLQRACKVGADDGASIKPS